jgi:hypothetical protein
MDVRSLLPQAMSISTPELLLPLGEGTLDDVDDLLTRELRVSGRRRRALLRQRQRRRLRARARHGC